MKITVCFKSVRVIVPCGNGDLSVDELTQRAIARYKKATNKHPDDHVQVQVLETIEEKAILDPDDIVSDVLDDKDKVVAIYDEKCTHRPIDNGGDGTSVSSIGTSSPDIFRSELTNIHNGLNIKNSSLSTKDENHNDTRPSKLIVVSSHINEKLPPPPVAPKPRGYKRKDGGNVCGDSLPSEDSGICISRRNRIGSDSSKSELSEISPRIIRTAETAFVAIGTPIQVDKPFDFNGSTPTQKKEDLQSKDFELEDDDDDDGTFSLGRNSARQSMFVDNPVLDRWAELQEKRMLEEQNSGNFHIMSVEEREDPAGASLSPTEDTALNFDSNVGFGGHFDAIDGTDSLCSRESDDTLIIQLQPDIPGDLGIKVSGYRTADGRELGLIVKDIVDSGCAAKDGQLQIADRILEINGKQLIDLPNERAEAIFSQESEAPTVKLVVSGAHSFVSNNKENAERVIQEPSEVEEPDVFPLQALPSESNGIEPPPGFRDYSRASLISNGPQLSTSMKKVNKRFLIELNKGNDGLGFSITTRDNPAGGNTPIFVKSILAKGAAIEDGQLKSGDQIIEVNGTEMTGKSQGEAVNILRSTRGLVKLLIQREEIIQAPTRPVMEINEESTRFLREEGKKVLTFKIPLSYSGAAGLGISVKGKVEGETPLDKGIYVKSVIAGGAAQKDGRLQADDQLLSVNNLSFLGVPNGEAIEKLRTAMQTTRLGQAFIEVTIARMKDSDEDSIHEIRPTEQERPIEAGLQALVQNTPSEPSPTEDVPEEPTPDVQSNITEDSQEEDTFSEASAPVPINLSPSKYRNIVHRNESYCYAIRGPQKRPIRPHITSKTELDTIQDRPSSTVAMPTPSTSTTDGQTKPRNLTPIPPPRGDSFNKSTIANYQIQRHMATANGAKYDSTTANGSLARQKVVINEDSSARRTLNSLPSKDNSGRKPNNALPSDESAIRKSYNNQPSDDNSARTSEESVVRRSYNKLPPEENSVRRSYNRLPSYEQTLERMRNRSSTSDLPEKEDLQNIQDIEFADTIPADSPFAREGFGRQSMSEKRARASVDAKKTQMYQIREKQKELNKTKPRPASEHDDVVNGTTPPLRKAKSDGQMQANSVKVLTDLPPSLRHNMWKSTSESSLRSNESDARKTSTSNESFRSAIENQSSSGLVPNGVTRQSQSEEQEIPITMTSKADFNAVQQKLTKKPFYKKFKLGKTRRGEYNLADAKGSPEHSLYNQEALIDFPSEQRYRQLISHYDDESNSNRSSSLPAGRRTDHPDGIDQSEQRSNVKIGRVIMTEPTRV